MIYNVVLSSNDLPIQITAEKFSVFQDKAWFHDGAGELLAVINEWISVIRADVTLSNVAATTPYGTTYNTTLYAEKKMSPKKAQYKPEYADPEPVAAPMWEEK